MPKISSLQFSLAYVDVFVGLKQFRKRSTRSRSARSSGNKVSGLEIKSGLSEWARFSCRFSFVNLAQFLGGFVGQVTDEAIKKVEIVYDGAVSKMNINAMTAAAIAGMIKSQVADVNMVSAPVMASERGITRLG